MKDNKFVKIFLVVIVGVTLINIILNCTFKSIVRVNENQMLYIYSTIGQIIAGIYGLILTAYIFFESKLKENVTEDDKFYDQVEVIRNDNFKVIKVISLISGLVILCCILCISIYTLYEEKSKLVSFITDQTMCLFIVAIIMIITFSCKLLNPNNLTKESTELKKNIEKKLKDKNSTQGNFADFLRNYNKLEKLIIDYSRALTEEKNDNRFFEYNDKAYRPYIMQAIKILIVNEIINRRLAEEIDYLRKYRNGVVHGTDMIVDNVICKRVKDIYDKLQQVYDNRNNSNKSKIAIDELNKLSKTDIFE